MAAQSPSSLFSVRGGRIEVAEQNLVHRIVLVAAVQVLALGDERQVFDEVGQYVDRTANTAFAIRSLQHVAKGECNELWILFDDCFL